MIRGPSCTSFLHARFTPKGILSKWEGSLEGRYLREADICYNAKGGNGSKCEELYVSKTRPLCTTEQNLDQAASYYAEGPMQKWRRGVNRDLGWRA